MSDPNAARQSTSAGWYTLATLHLPMPAAVLANALDALANELAGTGYEAHAVPARDAVSVLYRPTAPQTDEPDPRQDWVRDQAGDTPGDAG